MCNLMVSGGGVRPPADRMSTYCVKCFNHRTLSAFMPSMRNDFKLLRRTAESGSDADDRAAATAAGAAKDGVAGAAAASGDPVGGAFPAGFPAAAAAAAAALAAPRFGLGNAFPATEALAVPAALRRPPTLPTVAAAAVAVASEVVVAMRDAIKRSVKLGALLPEGNNIKYGKELMSCKSSITNYVKSLCTLTIVASPHRIVTRVRAGL